MKHYTLKGLLAMVLMAAMPMTAPAQSSKGPA